MTAVEAAAGMDLELHQRRFNATQFPITFSDDWRKGQADGEFLTTLNKERPEGRALLMSVLNGHVVGLETCLNTTIEVVGITCHPATKIDEDTGEMIHLTRVIIHCSDSNNYQSYGGGVVKSLRLLHALYGPDVWAVPRRCIPKRVNTSGSRSMYRLEWEA